MKIFNFVRQKFAVPMHCTKVLRVRLRQRIRPRFTVFVSLKCVMACARQSTAKHEPDNNLWRKISSFSGQWIMMIRAFASRIRSKRMNKLLNVKQSAFYGCETFHANFGMSVSRFSESRHPEKKNGRCHLALAQLKNCERRIEELIRH